MVDDKIPLGSKVPSGVYFADCLILPAKIRSFMGPKVQIVTDPMCPDDRLFFVDRAGNTHYFKYEGVNLAVGMPVKPVEPG